MRVPFFWLISAVVLAGCSATRNMQVRVDTLPTLVLPSEIKAVVVQNRALGGVGTTLEGILTGQVPGLQASLTEDCLAQVQAGLLATEAYQVKRADQALQASGPASTGFGAPLGWAAVERICKQYEADAMIALEYLDADFIVTQAARPTAQGGLMARGMARATAGYRIYLPKTKTIFYQKSLRRELLWTEAAANPLEAIAKIIKGPDALRAVVTANGQGFKAQLLGRSFWQERVMFKGKGNVNITRGYRLALASQWKDARDTWALAYDVPLSARDKGRAAYNLALANEVLGELADAQRWAAKAFVENGDRRAQRYAAILDSRLASVQ